MTEETLPLAELLAKAGDGDFLRSVAEAVVQLLMETDVDGLIGAGPHERTAERATYRRTKSMSVSFSIEDNGNNSCPAKAWSVAIAATNGEVMSGSAVSRASM